MTTYHQLFVYIIFNPECNGAEDTRLLREVEERVRPRRSDSDEEAQLPPRGKRVSAAQWNGLKLTPKLIGKDI